jgi:hypothetical protein
MLIKLLYPSPRMCPDLALGGRWQDQNFAIFLNKGDVSGNMTIFNLTLLAKIV